MIKKSGWSKKLLNARLTSLLVPMLIAGWVRLIYFSARIERDFTAASLPYLAGEQPAIFCFWHGRMVMHLLIKPRGRRMYVLSSRHNDGALITATMRWFGIDTVRGSRSKGASGALKNLFKVTREGSNISITPDGPRGPFQQAAAGAAFVAAKTGYPIIPVTFSAARAHRFRSWDRFMLPKLFTRIRFLTGEPIHVADDGDAALVEATAALDTHLARITAEADVACGVVP